jgi:hypothetical protein
VTEPSNSGGAPPALAPARPSNVPRNWVERWRAKQPEGSRRRRLYDNLALPIDPPTNFTGDERELARELTPHTCDEAADAACAAELLTEAQAIFERAERRSAGAQTRATTLQGAVAIAASLLLAGSGLVLNQTNFQGTVWRTVFAVLLVCVTVSLVMAGLRALSATSTIHVWHRPTARNIVERSQLSRTEARVQLAAETLVDYGYNDKIAAWKVAYLGAAAWWFRIALAFLVGLALLVGSYAVFGHRPPASTTSTTISKAPGQAKPPSRWRAPASGSSTRSATADGSRSPGRSLS